MSATWRNTDLGTFEVVDRQEPGVRLFGAVLLLPAGYLLYVLAGWVLELTRIGTPRDVLAGLPGVLVTLLIAGLFGASGAYMALRTRRSVYNKGDGSLRLDTSYGVYWRRREVHKSAVVRVFVISRPIGRNKLGQHRGAKPVPVHTVEIDAGAPPRIEIAEFKKPGPALELGRQLAGHLDTEFGQEVR